MLSDSSKCHERKESNYYMQHRVNVTASATATGDTNASGVNRVTVNTSEVNAV
jgi:hypothetical protein